ncbi:MAG: squalene/phytoene synthase family protein [Alphaproteobacteria bacterium]
MSNLSNNTLLTELKGKDYDRYILCMFGAAEHRDNLAALFLFNAELALVRDQVSEPLLGQIRLQWWRDNLKNLTTTGTYPPHPVLDRFAAMIARGIDLAPLHHLIDAREDELIAPSSPEPTIPSHNPEAITRPLAQVAATIIGQQAVTADVTATLLAYTEARLSHHAATENLVVLQKEKIEILRDRIKAMPRSLRRTAAPLFMHNDLAAYYMRRLCRRGSAVGHPNSPASRLWRLTYLLWCGVRVY